MSLSSLLDDPTTRDAIIADALKEVDAEVGTLGGLKGRLIHAGYDGVQRLRPGFLESNLQRLLPHFAAALDPHVAAGIAAGDVKAHLIANDGTVADDMLAITDRKAERSDNGAATALYGRLRKDARGQVIDAMPRIAAFVARHSVDG